MVASMADDKQPLPIRDTSTPAEQQGLFRKFEVRRTDGSSEPGGKHEGCECFVLDVDHDPLAPAALAAYASVCEATHPLLAADLRSRYGLPAPTAQPVMPEPVAWRYVGTPGCQGWRTDEPPPQVFQYWQPLYTAEQATAVADARCARMREALELARHVMPSGLPGSDYANARDKIDAALEQKP